MCWQTVAYLHIQQLQRNISIHLSLKLSVCCFGAEQVEYSVFSEQNSKVVGLKTKTMINDVKALHRVESGDNFTSHLTHFEYKNID